MLYFWATVLLLFLVRLIFPGITHPVGDAAVAANANDAAGAEYGTGYETSADTSAFALSDSIDGMTLTEKDAAVVAPNSGKLVKDMTAFFNADGTEKRTRIYSVPNFGQTFPDQNDVQLLAAQRHGVEPIQSQAEAAQMKSKLVYVGSNPYFYVDRLRSSIPYLVPRAAWLLESIGRSYFDSLQVKGIPLHKIIVTSVMRSKDDVAKLRSHNQNATQNSCHMYGTTFDVCYNRYKTVEDPAGPRRRAVTNDTLKWVLSEVLRDKRNENRCYVKYEVHQGCFHITVK